MSLPVRVPASAPGRAPPRIAFYAPMKAPDHPTPSGDRRIARLVGAALEHAGYEVGLASRLRLLDMAGDPARQSVLTAEAEAEAARIVEALGPRPPVAWVTYHCHYKAPDLLGPAVADRLGLPYLVIEPSLSPRRRTGPWASFAAAAETAIARADRLFWTTARDRPALEAAGHGARMLHLPAFLDAGAPVAPRPAGTPLRLLCVAMMRPGDKAESYARLGRALAALGGDWHLTVAGDGPARSACLAALAPARGRLAHVTDATTPAAVRALMEAADILVWPGVGEGVGMAWLEAQAAGLPVVAEDGPAAREIVVGGRLSAPDDPVAFAGAIEAVAAERAALSRTARAHVEAGHGLEAAAARLAAGLAAVVP